MVRNCVEWQQTKGYSNKGRKWCRWSQSSNLPAPVSLHYHPDVRTELSWLKPPCPTARLECTEKGGSCVLFISLFRRCFIMCSVCISPCCSPPAFCLFIFLLKRVFPFPRLTYLLTCWGLIKFMSALFHHPGWQGENRGLTVYLNPGSSPVYRMWGMTEG